MSYFYYFEYKCSQAAATLGGLLRSAAEGEVSCVVVEPSPSTSAGAVAPSLESIGTTCCDAAGSTTAAGHTGG